MSFEKRIPRELFQADGHYLGRPASYEDRIVQRRLRILSQESSFLDTQYTLLDIGCGNGASMLALSAQVKFALGVEISTLHQQEFEERKAAEHIQNCDFKVLDIASEDLDNQFDRIISFEVIEHLENEDDVAFYFNSLKSGGLMAISVPNKWWIFETHGAKLPLLPWNRVPFFSWLPSTIHEKYANARIYTKSRISKLLIKHGFEILDTKYVTAPMDVLPSGRFKDFVINNFFKNDTTSVPFKSTSIFVLAQKP